MIFLISNRSFFSTNRKQINSFNLGQSVVCFFYLSFFLSIIYVSVGKTKGETKIKGKVNTELL
jgi:hypothetical protein